MAKLRLLQVTQVAAALPPLALWALTVGGGVEVWMVYALVLARGLVNAVDNPTRQSFAIELVGADRVVNAVALNSVVVHSSRIIGPAAAGATIALLGVGPCFLLNAFSYLAMLVALRSMDPAAIHAQPAAAPRGPGQLRSAFAHVRSTPALWIPLAMMALVGTLSFNFTVLLPLLASFTWHGTATTYAALTSAMAVGSVAGALATGARGRVGPRLLVGAATGFGLVMLLAAAAPTVGLQIAVLVALGAVSVTFAAGVNSAMQLAVDPAMRGRVMALYSMVFVGTTPIGAPLVGWVADAVGPRAGLVLGAVAALVAAAGAHAAFARTSRPAPKHACEGRVRVGPSTSQVRSGG
jgi:MFS family permease